MKKICILLVSAILIVMLTGCGKYTSGYNAVGFVHSSDSDSAFMNFYSFKGRMVFKLKSSGEGELKYTAKLESGNATVYYDFFGTKQELFSISSEEELDSHGGYVEAGTVYIIVETDGTCKNGEFRFSLSR
ncbi:MAG TPA: hypothetical protein DHW39_07005 [Erysipelotrichaceae bacterium]|jgi:hypothetical protein|nr:hypothetical protein [Erysipelotrichaceae bacterium]